MTSAEQIDNIMDYFEFGNVQKMMEAVDWKWGRVGGVPVEGELRVFARELLQQAVRNGSSYLSSGGFTVRNEGVVLSLAFEASSWEAGA